MCGCNCAQQCPNNARLETLEALVQMLGVSVTPVTCEGGCGAQTNNVQPGHHRATELQNKQWRSMRCRCSTRTRYFCPNCPLPPALPCGDTCSKRSDYGHAHFDA
jgi:hypothetical protein